jgi:hypothetical protein
MRLLTRRSMVGSGSKARVETTQTVPNRVAYPPMDEGRIRKIIHIDMDAFYADEPCKGSCSTTPRSPYRVVEQR